MRGPHPADSAKPLEGRVPGLRIPRFLFPPIPAAEERWDLVVVGAGVAGLSAAYHAARAGGKVLVVSKGPLLDSATRFAQGGIAVALGEGDAPESHFEDTLRAGAGLCWEEAVRVLVDEGVERVQELVALGAALDLEGGALAFTREGGHSRPRVVHAGGDATGREVELVLARAAAAAGAELREGVFATDLLTHAGRCVGVAVVSGGKVVHLLAGGVILATGGVGQAYRVTTNPWPATGDGPAMALRAGASLADLEFLQFHPTALAVGENPRPLVSEAVRGEGAVLRDARGERIMEGRHPLGDLAPRDVVARAIFESMLEHGTDHVWLDATPIPRERFLRRFPNIHSRLVKEGLDPARDWIPVAPAAHYASGGVLVGLWGESDLPGLFVCGEAACTGVHGANRLASNSLLEGLVFGPRAAMAALSSYLAPPARVELELGDAEKGEASRCCLGSTFWDGTPPQVSSLKGELQGRMERGAGIVRSEESLLKVVSFLEERGEEFLGLGHAGRAGGELVNLALVAAVLSSAALARRESRGCHQRTDFPLEDPALRGRFVLRKEGEGLVLGFAPLEGPHP